MGRSVRQRQGHPEVQEPRFQSGVQEFQDMFRTFQAGGLRAVDVQKKVGIVRRGTCVVTGVIVLTMLCFCCRQGVAQRIRSNGTTN